MYLDSIKYNEDGTADITLRLNDTYNFTEIWTSMDGNEIAPFKISKGTVANDFGTITTKYDALNPFEVTIYLTVRRNI